jgi:hypothetical protein
MEKFDNRFPVIFFAGVLVLMPLSPLLGYLARKVRVEYGLDFVAGLYLATAPHLLFFFFMGGWLLKMYLDQLAFNRKNGNRSDDPEFNKNAE